MRLDPSLFSALAPSRPEAAAKIKPASAPPDLPPAIALDGDGPMMARPAAPRPSLNPNRPMPPAPSANDAGVKIIFEAIDTLNRRLAKLTFGRRPPEQL